MKENRDALFLIAEVLNSFIWVVPTILISNLSNGVQFLIVGFVVFVLWAYNTFKIEQIKNKK